LKDSCKLKVSINEKYKNSEIIYPDYIEIKKLHHEVMQRREQISDVLQMSQLLVNNPNLRNRVWRGIAIDINNRCTD